MKTKYTRRIVDHVKVIKEGIMKYEDGSYIELYLLGVTSPYPIFAKVDHKNLEYKFLNFTCESHKIEGFHVLRDNVDIHSHIKEKPHWFI